MADDWAFFVHPDGEWVSINDGTHGDTLLKMPEGSVDRERVRQFAAALSTQQSVQQGQEGRLREGQVAVVLSREEAEALDKASANVVIATLPENGVAAWYDARHKLRAALQETSNG